MKLLASILNLPWTLLALVGSLASVPTRVYFRDWAMVVNVRSFWWYAWLPSMRGVRGMAMGNVVLLGPNILDKDLDHEFVHIEQFQRLPFIFPFLSFIELVRRGNRYSIYEDEAYRRAGNIYKTK